MLLECQRVLKVGGFYIAISYGVPENRMMHLERSFLNWKIKTIQIEKKSQETDEIHKHYIYICEKQEEFEEDVLKEKYFQAVKEIKLQMAENNGSDDSDNELGFD